MSSTLSQVFAARPVSASQMLAAMLLYLDDTAAAAGSKDKAAQVTELRKALSGYHASTNDGTGSTTITPGVLALQHTEIVTITGGAGTRALILDTTQVPAAGDRIALRINMPATANIVIQIHTGTISGAVIETINADASGASIAVEFYYDGAAWSPLRASYPA